MAVKRKLISKLDVALHKVGMGGIAGGIGAATIFSPLHPILIPVGLGATAIGFALATPAMIKEAKGYKEEKRKLNKVI